MFLILKNFLRQKSSRFYHIVKRLYDYFFAPRLIVKLSRNNIPRARLYDIENDDSLYNGIVDDLVAYTGFSREKLVPYLLRCPEKHFESEFNWFKPKDELELTWFYRCSSAYLFANAIHPYVSKLDIIRQGKVLDYGAGAGL